ncbi:MAG: hypothetical protein EPN36_14030 [Rhodanobacteraceae bacterium]|nr:MAG: hypothetical protein EPN36_14030 [Rhodanobacteraceae bacterium]
MKRKSFSVVDLAAVALLDSMGGSRGREMRYVTAQCIADLFNKFIPQREFVVVHDGHPIKRQASRMQRFYSNLEELRV